MRIAIVTTFPPSKASLNEYAYHFVEALMDKQEVEDIYLLVDELPETFDQADSYPSRTKNVHIIPTWRFNAVNNTLRIMKKVREIKPDTVLFNLQFASFGDRKVPATLGLLSPFLVKLFGIPTIALLHNIMETVDLSSAGYGNNPVVQAVMKAAGTIITWLVLRSDLVATTLPQYVEILTEKYNANNVVLVPHGTFDYQDEYQFNKELPPGPMQIMTFGKFGTYKKVELLIDAFELLNQSDNQQELELVIAGTSSPNAPGYIENLMEQYRGHPSIRFTGYVLEEDVPIVFRDAAVVVFPYTSTTGSSGVLHQAGSYGKAVVLPEIGDFITLITEEGYSGETYDPLDASSMAKAIARIIDDSERRIRLGEQNYLAAKGLPMSEVVDWYLMHMESIQESASHGKSQASVSSAV